ncbi:LOW QUALITY PROTEIN: alpha-tectorin, partial [Fundulus heteroclitus]|uniref:LOW QUALITY PROTEIN: alpha-tectorin n=1 Tax=Fundulus heteroclitus TaxID=8078 RepID=UPI00165A915C
MAGQIIIPVLLLLATGGVTTQAQGPLYPYQNLGVKSPRSDDGSAPRFNLPQSKSFNFFGQHYSQIFLNNNGDLTFDAPWSSYIPEQFPRHGGRDIIAPFWADLDNTRSGNISYFQRSSGPVLQQVSDDINVYFPALSFHANWVFIATWENVAYFNENGKQTTFQVVLTTDGQFSFVLMNYGSIANTSKSVQAGYDTADSSHHFSIPGSMTNNAVGSNSFFRLHSNVNVPGRWVFRVDQGSTGCNYNGQSVQLGDSFWSDSTCAQKCTCTTTGVQCINEPCPFSQVCKPTSFQYSCMSVDRRTCTVGGETNTFDNATFPLQSTCTHVLSEQCQNNVPFYRVEGKNELGGSTQLVKVFVYNQTIELNKGAPGVAKVNGNSLPAPFALSNGAIRVNQSGSSMIISTDFGVLVSYDMSSHVRISVPYTYQNNTCGLCGNFNNHPEDDFTTPQGLVVSSEVVFAKSWKVAGVDPPGCENEPTTTTEPPTTSPCEELHCTEYERCGEKDGVYGCFCDEHHHRPNNESYDSNITCSSSSGIMSISRCQLFEAGFHSSALHLRNESCTGTIQDGRLVFHFDNDEHLCGTTLRSNGTHFMYENTIQGDVDTHGGLISRQRTLNLSFCCVYPLEQALSMAVGINPMESIVDKKLPVGTGSYRLIMTPYEDEDFLTPFSTNAIIGLEINKVLFVEVKTVGVDEDQLSTILESCWATPENNADHPVRWDLIDSQCPNPADGTVEVIKNGVLHCGTFSFRMFTFTNYTEIYLHCNVHLCSFGKQQLHS